MSPRAATPRRFSTYRTLSLFASSLTSSLFPDRAFVCLEITSLLGAQLVKFRRSFGRGRGLWLAFTLLLYVSRARAQGPAPETAPPLFPGGGLISYNSIFTTRGLMPAVPGGIPVTARPTFSHEGDFNFTWGFYRDFDLTVLIPIVTNRFDRAAGTALRGTGLGDAMVLVKYRFYRRDSQRGTTQASVSFGPRSRPAGQTRQIAMEIHFPPVCSPVRVQQISFWLRIGLTRGFSRSGAWWPMRTSIPSCARRGHRKPGSAVISSRVSGCPTDRMNRRMWRA